MQDGVVDVASPELVAPTMPLLHRNTPKSKLHPTNTHTAVHICNENKALHVADHDNTVTEHDEAVAIADPATSMFILEPVDVLYGLAATKPQVLMQHTPVVEVGLDVVDAGHVESIEVCMHCDVVDGCRECSHI